MKPRARSSSVPSPLPLRIDEYVLSNEYLGGSIPPLSPAQMSLLKALNGLDLTPEERDAYLAMTEGRVPRKGGYDEAVWICGVRGGKTMLASIEASFESLRWGPVVEQMLLPGQVATGILIAQDKRAAGVARDYIVGHFQTLEERGHDVLAPKVGQEKAVTGALVKLRWPVEIAIYPANAYSVRGATGLWFIGDECAYWKSEDGAYNQDVKVWRAVRTRFATLARLKPKRLLLSSKGEEQGLLYEQWKNREHSKSMVAVAETQELNPSIDPVFLQEERDLDPEEYEVEYGKAWRKPGGGNCFLPAGIVDQCVVRGLRQIPPKPGVDYLAWMDAAFKRDRFSFGIAHLEGRTDVARVVVDHSRHWTPPKGRPLDDDEVIAEVTEDLRAYGIDTIHGDQFADIPLKGNFRKRGILFVEAPVSNPEKYEAFKNLRAALRARMVDLLDDPEMIRDLKGLIKRETAGGYGYATVAAPKRVGCYDDGANVLARLVQNLMPHQKVDIETMNRDAMRDDDRRGLDWTPRDGGYREMDDNGFGGGDIMGAQF